MIKGPGLFSNIGKKARDVLYKDYNYDRKLSITTQTADGLALTSTTLQKESHNIADIAAQYKYKNTVIDVKLDTQSNIATTLTFADVLPSTKSIASVKLPDYQSTKFEVQYFHEHAAISSSISLKRGPVLNVSATCAFSNIVLGAEASYNTFTGDLTQYNTAISVTKPDYCTSIVLADKADLLTASYIYNIDQARFTTVVEFTNRFSKDGNTLTVGGSCAIDDSTLIKLKLNNQGNFGALLQHELRPKSVLTMAAEFDYNSLDTYPKFGLALALRP